MGVGVATSPGTHVTFLVGSHLVKDGDIQLWLVEYWWDTHVLFGVETESSQGTILQEGDVPVFGTVGWAASGG